MQKHSVLCGHRKSCAAVDTLEKNLDYTSPFYTLFFLVFHWIICILLQLHSKARLFIDFLLRYNEYNFATVINGLHDRN